MLPVPRLTAAVALVVALAGCSDGEPADTEATDTAGATPSATPSGEVDQDVLDAIAEAANTTVEEGTARFALTVETEGTQAADGQAPVTAEGEEDFTNERRQFTFDGPRGELRVIVDGSDAYIEMPATEDEKWAQLELDRLSGGDFGFGGPGGLPFQGVADNVAFLSDAATRAEEAGDEDVEGESATRYEVTVDLEEAAEESGEDVEDGLRRGLRETGVRTLDVTVWVDEEGRIAQVRYALDLAQAEIGEGEVEAEPEGRAVVTVAYRDFGEELDIQVPSGDAVVELDEDELRDAFGGEDTEASATPSRSPRSTPSASGSASPSVSASPSESER